MHEGRAAWMTHSPANHRSFYAYLMRGSRGCAKKNYKLQQKRAKKSNKEQKRASKGAVDPA